MDDKKLAFLVPVYTTKYKKIACFPYDEVIPAGVMFGLLMLAKCQLTAFICAVLWFKGLRMIKARHGDKALGYFAYWFFQSQLGQLFFKRTTPSNRRYWIF